MTDVRELIERAAQIAESHAYCGCNGKHGACLADDTPKAIAAEIRALAPRSAAWALGALNKQCIRAPRSA